MSDNREIDSMPFEALRVHEVYPVEGEAARWDFDDLDRLDEARNVYHDPASGEYEKRVAANDIQDAKESLVGRNGIEGAARIMGVDPEELRESISPDTSLLRQLVGSKVYGLLDKLGRASIQHGRTPRI